MSEDRRIIAQDILEEALDVIINQRQNAHGGAENSFAAIGAFWTTFLRMQGHDIRHEISAYDVAQMMALLKLVRASMGNGVHADHYVDAAGYTALAGMLAGAATKNNTRRNPVD